MLFGLLWNRNLRGFWRQQLGESFLQRMLRHGKDPFHRVPALSASKTPIPGLSIPRRSRRTRRFRRSISPTGNN